MTVVWRRLKHFLTPFDDRFEDLLRGNVAANFAKDLGAGLVVALIAIPLAMGFAIASGLRPEQGIVGGAVAGFVGAMFGGSKYQVYGPTAAFIPIIAAIMAQYDHGFLVTASLLAGVVLWGLGLAGAGKVVKLVPHSVVVGFTIGIAATIALSQVGEVFGLKAKLGYDFFEKIAAVREHFGTLEIEAVVLALGTLWITRTLAKVSPFLPAPLVALAVGVVVSETLFAQTGLALVSTKYGEIPPVAVMFTPPTLPGFSSEVLFDLGYAALAIVFVAAIESLLCSRMADRLAGNTGKPYDPDKELWGQGHVMALVPLLNGFPHTGALARTATNIKLGAVSPLSGILKAALKLLLAFYLASYLGRVPMACIGGILLYVASNMVKREEVEEVVHLGRAHIGLMIYTAVAVIVTDFLRGVVSALVLYAVGFAVQKVLEARREANRRRRVRPGAHEVQLASPSWSLQVAERPSLHRTAFVHPAATLIGRVVLGPNVHVAAGASVRADEGSPFYVGANCNLQDGVVLHALKDRHVLVAGERWAIHLGDRVSLAHQALVHGPTAIGDDCFVGFKAVVHDSVLGPGCFVGIGATVVGVTLAANRFVPHGAVIDEQAMIDALSEGRLAGVGLDVFESEPL
ncbi:MAG: SulP family inorganic anion transporter, partial [Myxococcota bacterium]